jgi:hypothetical protein
MSFAGRALILCLSLSLLGFPLSSLAGGPEGEGKSPAPQVPRVTLKGKDMPLAEALAEVRRQTGIAVRDATGKETRVAIDLDRAPFWEALDALAASASARVDVHHRDGLALTAQPAWYHPPPVSHDGLFRTALKRIVVTRDLETGSAASKLVLEVAWVPTLEPFYLETRPHQFRLRTGGKDLAGPAGSSFADVEGRRALAFEVDVPGVVGDIDLLEGKLSVIGPSKMLTFTFPTLDRLAKPGGSATQEGVTCKVTRVTLRNSRWSVSVAIDYPPGNRELDSYQSWAVNNDVVLVSTKDAKKRIASDSYVIERMSSRQARITYHFLNPKKRGLGAPGGWKVTYRTPARVVEIPFRFSFKDVKLP